MIRTACLILLAMALNAQSDDWEHKVLSYFKTRGDDLSRIARGNIQKGDTSALRTMASYMAYKAERHATNQRDVDSLETALDLARMQILRQYRSEINRLSSGGKPKASDSTIIQILATLAGAELAGRNHLELTR